MQFVGSLNVRRTRTGAGYLLDCQRLQLVQAHGTCPREGPNLFMSLVLPVQRRAGHVSKGLS